MKTNRTITLDKVAGLRNAGPLPRNAEVVGTIGILALIRFSNGNYAGYAGGVTSSVNANHVKAELEKLAAN